MYSITLHQFYIILTLSLAQIIHFDLCHCINSTTTVVRTSTNTLESLSGLAPNISVHLITKDNKDLCIKDKEGQECLQLFCFESKISFTKRVVHFNWKIHNLRQYIDHRCAHRFPFVSAVLLQQQFPFQHLPTGNADWNFQIRCGPGDNPVQFSVICNVNSSVQDYHQLQNNSNETIYNILLSAREEHGQKYVSEDWQNSSMICNESSVNYTCSISFTWGLHMDNTSSFLENLKNLINRVDTFDLNFEIQSSTPDAILSEEMNCSRDVGVELKDKFAFNSLHPPFLHQMQAIIKDDKYTDLVLKSGDEEFKVHRIILANSSPVFARMVSNDSFVRNESLLDLGVEIGSDIVEEIVHYIYTGTIEGIEEIADRVILAAAKYEFPDLKRICEKVLVSQLTTDNAFNMYFLGVEVNSEKLKQESFNVLKQNKAIVANQAEEFRKLSVHHPDLMYKLFLS